MAVDGAVAAKKQDHIGLIGSRGHPDAPVDMKIVEMLVDLKRLEVFLRTSQPKDDSSAHVRG
jgi:hypothetical protein